MGLGYIFYNRIWTGIFLIPVGVLFYKEQIREENQRNKMHKLQEFKDFITSVSAALSAGYSLENAVKEGYRELLYLYGEKCEMSIQISLVLKEIRLNKPFHEVMQELGKRCGVEEIISFAGMVSAAKQSGGNLTELIKSCALDISEKSEQKRELETMINGRKYEQKVMNVVPLAIICYVRITSYDMFSVLYEGILGPVIMSVCLILYVAAICIAEKMMRIEL